MEEILGLDFGVQIVGPFTEHKVVVGGREVPYLTAFERDGGEIELTFDHRLQITVPAAQFQDVAHFVASVIQQCFHPDLGRRFPVMQEVWLAAGGVDAG